MLILEFFKEVHSQVNKMGGFIAMDILDDSLESMVLAFWESKEDMDNFYQTVKIMEFWQIGLKNSNPLLKTT